MCACAFVSELCCCSKKIVELSHGSSSQQTWLFGFFVLFFLVRSWIMSQLSSEIGQLSAHRYKIVFTHVNLVSKMRQFWSRYSCVPFNNNDGFFHSRGKSHMEVWTNRMWAKNMGMKIFSIFWFQQKIILENILFLWFMCFWVSISDKI